MADEEERRHLCVEEIIRIRCSLNKKKEVHLRE